MESKRRETAQVGVAVLGGPLADLLAVTRAAEAAGFDSAWTTEFYDRSSVVSLAAMAAETERISIGSAITYAFGRSPMVLATEAQDIDVISRGRLILGLGTGTYTMQRDWLGVDPSSPAPRIEELIPLLRLFWARDPNGVHHDGRFFRAHVAPPEEYLPEPRDIPIYLAGVNARMIRAAGFVADGLIGHPLFTRRYVEDIVLPALDDGRSRREGGKDEQPFPIAGYVICSIHNNVDLARREAKAQIAFYSTVRTYKRMMEVNGWESEAREIRSAWERRDYGQMIACVSDQMVDRMAACGNIVDVRDQIRQRLGWHLYDRTLLYAPSFGLASGRVRENMEAIVELFADQRVVDDGG